MTESDLLWSENIQIHGSYWYYSTWKWSYIIIWCSMKCKILIHILLQKHQAVFFCPNWQLEIKSFGQEIPLDLLTVVFLWAAGVLDHLGLDWGWAIVIVIWRSATVGGGDFSWICSNSEVNGWLSKFNVCYCWSFSDTQTHPDLLLLFDFFPIVLNNGSFNSFGSQLPLIHLYLTHLLHTHTPVHH